MTRDPRSRRTARLAAAGVAGALAAALLSPPAMAGPGTRGPDTIVLPAGFQPEGIAIGRHGRAWTGALSDGDIYEIDLRTGEGEVVSEGPGTSSVGLKVDRRGRLFVAGGDAGDARVVDTRTGEVLATYQLGPAGSTFVNDVILTRRAAWFTDSLRGSLPGAAGPAAAGARP